MSWHNRIKPPKKMKPLKLSKWEEVYYGVAPARDMHTKAIEVECCIPTIISECEKWVFYLEDRHNAAANALFSKYYKDITKMFEREGYTFIYAPKEAEKIAKHYGMPLPDVEWNAPTLLEMLQCQCNEPIGSALAIIDMHSGGRPYTPRLHCVSIDTDSEEGVIAILKALWESLYDDNSNIRYRASEDEYFYETNIEEESCRMSGNLFTEEGESTECKQETVYKECRINPTSKRRYSVLSNILEKLHYEPLVEEVDELTEEDEQLLSEISERVEKLRLRGIKQHLIEQFVRMTVHKSHLEVTPDARILLTDYNKEVQMLPIDKVVYIFYLRHPEGISIKSLADHKEELMGLYARVTGKTELTYKQKESVERLCDPTDNSINEKLSRIRKSFCAEVHESVAANYIIQGTRGEDRYISLDEELIELGDWGR